jgi:hypothetical protein
LSCSKVKISCEYKSYNFCTSKYFSASDTLFIDKIKKKKSNDFKENIFFIFILSINNVSLAEKYLEVQKLYDLYSQDILTIDQLNSGLEKMNLNNQNMNSLISLRKDGVIKEDDFIDGVKKIVTGVSNPENDIKENDNNIKSTTKMAKNNKRSNSTTLFKSKYYLNYKNGN